MDCESLRLRGDTLQAVQNDILTRVEERLEQEFQRLSRLGQTSLDPSAAVHIRAAIDVGKRMDETDSRVAALRVRMDASEARCRSMGDRSEAANHQYLQNA